MDWEFHPWTRLFPLADGNGLEKLALDIRQYGQSTPIMLHEGKILDGRSRYRACTLIGVEPITQEYDGIDPLGWMINKNLLDRNLSVGQKIAVAVGVILLEPKMIPDPGKARESFFAAYAEKFGVGRSGIERMFQCHNRKPELLERVRDGELSLSEASREAGFKEYHTDEVALGAAFGRGDKFQESTEPLLRYLNAWARRDYEFRTVSPKEAARRLKKIDEIIEKLGHARTDLQRRAVRPRLTL